MFHAPFRYYPIFLRVQLAVMADELQGVRQQLSQLQEKQPKQVKENLMNKVEHIQEKITDLSECLSAIKDHLVETAAQAVSAFKDFFKTIYFCQFKCFFNNSFS